MEKNKDSRKIKSRHAKVSRTGRNLEESLMAAGGIIAYTSVKSLDKLGRNQGGQYATRGECGPRCVAVCENWERRHSPVP